MILKYQEVRKENSELYAMVDERDKEIAELKKSVSEWEKEYKALKMAKMIEMFEENDDVQNIYHNWENEDEYEED